MDIQRALKQLTEIKKLGGDMRLAAEEWKSPWQTLIAIILSARTRDEVTIEVCKKLFAQYPDAKSLASASVSQIESMIKSVNFYRNKTKSIINCSRIIFQDYGGSVPHDFEKLIDLPGVGRKTANVFLAEFDHDAIGVDTHVSYISQKLGWVKSSHPHKIEQELKQLFPSSYWGKLNLYLVRFGKEYTSRKKKDELLEKIKAVR
ncbi:endonuclease III [Candidatus Pacearchaeota archaeon]|nr:endonuclease III [Candidatus Pacearchaeota archaeon]